MGQKSTKTQNLSSDWEFISKSNFNPLNQFEPTNSTTSESISNSSSYTPSASQIRCTSLAEISSYEDRRKFEKECHLNRAFSKSMNSIKCPIKGNKKTPLLNEENDEQLNSNNSSSSEDDSEDEAERRIGIGSLNIQQVTGKVIVGNIRQNSYQEPSMVNSSTESDFEGLLKNIKAKLQKSYQPEVYIPTRKMASSPKDALYVTDCANVQIITMPPTQTQNSQQSVSVQYLGTLLQHHKTVLLEGHPGYGKSIIASQLICNWMYESVESLNYFQLVYFIKAEKFDTTVMDFILQKSLMEDYDDKEMLLTVLKKYQNFILIIIDGYDQLKPSQRKEIQSLIKGKIFSRSSVIVTSRPEAAAKIFCLFKFHLKTCGFAPIDIKKYAKSFLGEDSYKKLWDVLSSEIPDFYVYLQCPFYLFLQCSEWREKSTTLSPTLTDLILYIVKEAINKCFQLNEPLITSNSTCEQILDCLGRFCFELVQKQQTEFSREELKHCIHNVIDDTDREMSLGLLLKSEGESTYHFLHSAFMELIAAYYIYKEFEKDEVCCVLKNVLHNIKDKQTFLPAFIAGLIKNTNSQLFLNLISCFSHDRFLYLINLLIQSGNFSENIEIVCGFLSEWLVLNFSQPYSSEICNSDAADISNFMDLGISLVSSRDLFVVNISQWEQMICEVISHPCCPIKNLILSINSMSAVKCLQNIISRLGENSKISSLVICSSEMCLFELLQALNNCKSVSLLALTLKTSDSDQFFNQLKKWPSTLTNNQLESFSFVINPVSSGKSIPLRAQQLEKLSSFLLCCKNLHHLKVYVDNSSKKAMMKICELLEKLAITHLTLTVEKTLAPSFNLKHFCRYLKKTTCTLTTLDFSYSQLSLKDIRELEKTLSESMCTLTSLSLAYCFPTTHTILTISLNSLISSTRKWTSINLSGWKLQYRADGNDVGTVNQISLIDCELDGVSIHEIISVLKVKKLECSLLEIQNLDKPIGCDSSLQSLWLQKPNINSLSLETICKQLSTFSCLKELGISLEIDSTTEASWNAPWSSLMVNSSFSKLQLNLNCFSCNEDYDKTGKIFFEVICTTLRKSESLEHLTLCVFTEQFWQKYLKPLLREVVHAFKNHKLYIFEIILDEQHFDDILIIIEDWNMNHNDQMLKVVTKYLTSEKSSIQLYKLINQQNQEEL